MIRARDDAERANFLATACLKAKNDAKDNERKIASFVRKGLRVPEDAIRAKEECAEARSAAAMVYDDAVIAARASKDAYEEAAFGAQRRAQAEEQQRAADAGFEYQKEIGVAKMLPAAEPEPRIDWSTRESATKDELAAYMQQQYAEKRAAKARIDAESAAWLAKARAPQSTSQQATPENPVGAFFSMFTGGSAEQKGESSGMTLDTATTSSNGDREQPDGQPPQAWSEQTPEDRASKIPRLRALGLTDDQIAELVAED